MMRLSTRSFTRWLPAATLAAFLASACANPIAPDATASRGLDASKGELAKQEEHTVPLVGDLIGYSYAIAPATPCVAPRPNRTGIDLAGEMSHLGRTLIAMEHCNSSSSAVGTATLTSANGDEVWLSYTQDASGVTILDPPPLPIVVRFIVPFVVTGGTGRFSNARGEGSATCVRTSPVSTAGFPVHTPAYANYYECEFDGMISTVGQS